MSVALDDRYLLENGVVYLNGIQALVPDGIRGYEEIKLRNVKAVRERTAELVARLDEAKAPTSTRR